MSQTAPAGLVYVHDRHGVTHVARYELGVYRLPALCGAEPAKGFNPITHSWDGPARWENVRRAIPSYAAVCPACRQVAP